MPQPSQQNIEEGSRTNDYPHQDQSTPNPLLQFPQRESNFGDSSGPLFSLYSRIADEEDNKMTDRWKKDADGILFFTGLFSAAVAALLAVSVQDLRPNPQDTSAFYLANIYQIFADPSATLPRLSTPSAFAIPPPFSPPRYAIWVNSLWFMSLVTSLTCALLATSLQQWARRYIVFTQPPRSSPEKRARMRAFFAHGVNKMHLPWAVESLPALIHLSLLLFFGGLIIFLFNINQSVFIAVIWWTGLFLTLYGWITVMPMLRHDSPFYTPLSLAVWSFHASMLYALFTVSTVIASSRFVLRRRWQRIRTLRSYYGDRMSGGMWKAMEETASRQSSDFDLGILDWTLGSLGEDDTLEKFFEAIPGFSNSKLVKDIQRSLPDSIHWKFVDSLCGFLGRNLLSSSISEELKIRRLVISMNATNAICSSFEIRRILGYLSKLPFDQAPQTIQTVQVLGRWGTNSEGDDVSRGARELAVCIFPNVRERDDHWIAFVRDQFGLSEHVLRTNIAHGDDSVLLAILIHVTRQFTQSKLWDLDILSSLSKFDVHNTIPELRNQFCALWNEIVLMARMKGSLSHPVHVLRNIRHVYIALHQSTDAAPTQFSASTAENDYFLYKSSSYPLCNITAHHPDSPVARPTQVGDPNYAFPYPPRLESQPYLCGSTVPRQPDDVDIVPCLPSSPDYTSPHPQGFPSPSSTTGPPHTLPQITVAPDVDPLDVTEISCRSRQVPMSTVELVANIVHPDEPKLAIPISEIGEFSQTPAATSPTFPYPDSVPDAVIPSTVTLPSSVSVQYSDLNKKQDSTAVPHTVSNITEISSTTSHIPRSIPNLDVILLTDKDSIGSPPTIDPGSRYLPMMPLEPTTTAAVSVREHNEAHDVTYPIPMEVSAQQSGPSMYDIVEAALPPDDYQNAQG